MYLIEITKNGGVAELVDARDLKSRDGNVVRVRFPPSPPAFASFRKLRLGRPLIQKGEAKAVTSKLMAHVAKTDTSLSQPFFLYPVSHIKFHVSWIGSKIQGPNPQPLVS